MVEAYHDRVRRDVFPMLPERVGRLLDVGGGVGATSGAIRDAGLADSAVLLDQVANGAIPSIDHAIAGNLEDPALFDHAFDAHGPFDTILCLDVLEHLTDPWSVVRRLSLALADGGSLIISLPNMNHVSVVAPLVFNGRFDLEDEGIRDRTHLRWFTRHSGIALAEAGGLQVDRIQANIYSRKYRMLDALSLRVLTRFLASQYVIRARLAK